MSDLGGGGEGGCGGGGGTAQGIRWREGTCMFPSVEFGSEE